MRATPRTGPVALRAAANGLILRANAQPQHPTYRAQREVATSMAEHGASSVLELLDRGQA